MGILEVKAGINPPEDINVVIEIPKQSGPIKYEVNKETGTLSVDRFLTTSMYYPCDYGYIPQTLSEDGDPIDVLVITPIPVNWGCVIRCRPVGMLSMIDEAGIDRKILAVPVDKLTSLYKDIQKVEDLPPVLIKKITHFFLHYKDLEDGKWVKLDGWRGPDEAKAEIMAGIKSYGASQA